MLPAVDVTLASATETVTLVQLTPLLLPTPRTPRTLPTVDVTLASATETVTFVQLTSP